MIIRLFVEETLVEDYEFYLKEKQVHYLFNVLRVNAGDNILCFDNKTGEYECKVLEIGKKTGLIKAVKKTKEFAESSDIWLLFAPVKKDNTDFIVEKATELGVQKIIPTITKRTNSEKVRSERLQMQAIEASEQSRRVDVPVVEEAKHLSKLLEEWDSKRTLFFMDETLNGESIKSIFEKTSADSIAILVGPEGGFSEDELTLLRKLPFAKAVTMGKRILRSETAVVAALSCWQAIKGDWN